MTYLFQQLAKKGRELGINLKNAAMAREWFRMAAKKVKNPSANEIMSSDNKRFLPTRNMYYDSIGKMIMFFYDATTKEKLPYWDQFPIIFVIGIKDDGFLGINLHYLSPYQRAKLMDQLYTTMTSNKSAEAKMRINYQILKANSRFRLFRPCVKHYKWGGVRSRFFVVKPEEWDFIVMLPIERFVSMQGGQYKNILKSKVWADSMKKLKGN